MNDIKILINNQEEWDEVQEICFKKGISWVGDQSTISMPYGKRHCQIVINPHGLGWCSYNCSFCPQITSCDVQHFPEIPAKDFIQKHREKDNTFIAPEIKEEKTDIRIPKVNDDYFYELQIDDTVQVILTGTICGINIRSNLNELYHIQITKEHTVWIDPTIHGVIIRKVPSSKELNEQADQKTIENAREHMRHIEHSHSTIKCKNCDKIIMQCRCMMKDKPIVYRLCASCTDMMLKTNNGV